jgi:hypothetical protein
MVVKRNICATRFQSLPGSNDSSPVKLEEKAFGFRGVEKGSFWKNPLWNLFGQAVFGMTRRSDKFFCIVRPKLLTPLSNRFIGHGDASFGEEFFDFTEAQTEPMVEPHRMTNNFRGKPVTLVAGCWLFHAAQSAKPELN